MREECSGIYRSPPPFPSRIRLANDNLRLKFLRIISNIDQCDIDDIDVIGVFERCKAGAEYNCHFAKFILNINSIFKELNPNLTIILY